MQIEFLNPRILNHVEKDLRAFGRSLSRPGAFRQPFEKIRDEVLMPSIAQNFARQGRPQRWPAITIDTIQWRARVGRGQRSLRFTAGATAAFDSGAFSGKILIFTKKLMNAATAKARWLIRNNVMTYGSFPEQAWYAVVHNNPEIAARANIPHRPFAMVQIPEDPNAMVEIMSDWLEKQFAKHVKRHYI